MGRPTDAQLAAHTKAIRSAEKAYLAVEGDFRETVAAARDAGLSWAQIGEALGVSRQAVWERFEKRAEDAAARLSIDPDDRFTLTPKGEAVVEQIRSA